MAANSQQRILFYTENYMRGGGNKYLIDLVNAALAANNEAVILSNRNGIFKTELQQLIQPVPHYEVSVAGIPWFMFITRNIAMPLRLLLFIPIFFLTPFLILANMLKMLRQIRRISPDLIISANGGYPAASTCLQMTILAGLLGKKNYLSVVSMPADKSIREIWAKPRDYLVGRVVTGVIVNAGNIKQKLVEQRGFQAEKIHIVYNGIPDYPIDSLVTRTLQHPTFGFVGRLDRAKGIRELIGAFGNLAVQFPEIRLVLVGKGDQSHLIESWIQHHGLENQVLHYGYIEGNIDEILRRMDIFILPSYQEGLPYSILEGMRAGCAIIASNVGGIPEIIFDENTGLLVPPADQAALEAAMRTLLLHPEKIRKLGIGARERYLKTFTLNQMYSNLQLLLQK